METRAVLASGGLDSAVLLYDLAQAHEVVPLYVAKGLAWEREEQRALEGFVARLAHPRVRPPVILPLPVGGLYGNHWSVTGVGVPAADQPDEDVFLPARNVLLFTAAAIWCYRTGVQHISVGSLEGNPFPDATDAFFTELARLLSTALSHTITIAAPFRHATKASLIARFQALPLELTLTCNAPHDGQHCGGCNKCYERQQAFRQAAVPDRTPYARGPQ